MLVLIAAAHAGAGCPSSSTTLDLQARDALAAWEASDPASFESAASVLAESMRCPGDRVGRGTVVHLHEVAGLRAFTRGDEVATRASFAAVRALYPDYVVSDGVAAPGSELRALIDAVLAPPVRTTSARAGLVVDASGSDLPTGRAAYVQDLTRMRGWYVLPDDIPEEILPGRVPVAARGSRRHWEAWTGDERGFVRHQRVHRGLFVEILGGGADISHTRVGTVNIDYEDVPLDDEEPAPPEDRWEYHFGMDDHWNAEVATVVGFSPLPSISVGLGSEVILARQLVQHHVRRGGRCTSCTANARSDPLPAVGIGPSIRIRPILTRWVKPFVGLHMRFTRLAAVHVEELDPGYLVTAPVPGYWVVGGFATLGAEVDVGAHFGFVAEGGLEVARFLNQSDGGPFDADTWTVRQEARSEVRRGARFRVGLQLRL